MNPINTLDPMIRRKNVDDLIDRWFEDRDIFKNGTPLGQAIKTLEETTELLDAINKEDEAEVLDAIGDIYVTLRGVCGVMGIDLVRCAELAYDEIKDRKGTLGPDGIFRKEVHKADVTLEELFGNAGDI